MPQELKINFNKTAIVVIDLQKGITTFPVEPIRLMKLLKIQLNY